MHTHLPDPPESKHFTKCNFLLFFFSNSKTILFPPRPTSNLKRLVKTLPKISNFPSFSFQIPKEYQNFTTTKNKPACLEATLVRNNHRPSDSLTGVRYRAFSVAKNFNSHLNLHVSISIDLSSDPKATVFIWAVNIRRLEFHVESKFFILSGVHLYIA